jgi:hypothetical protein
MSDKFDISGDVELGTLNKTFHKNTNPAYICQNIPFA